MKIKISDKQAKEMNEIRDSYLKMKYGYICKQNRENFKDNFRTSLEHCFSDSNTKKVELGGFKFIKKNKSIVVTLDLSWRLKILEEE